MEFLPSQKIPLTDGLSRLIPKIRKPLKETVIASVTSEMDIKNVLYNTIKEQPVTVEEIRLQAKFDKFITQKTNEIMDQEKSKRNNIFSICNGIFSYGDRLGNTSSFNKKS